MNDDIEKDIAAIGQIEAIPSILEVVCQTTGMGFAAVARVTDDRWVACEVLDTVQFGLQPGGELRLDTTLCAQVRTERTEIVIDDVKNDPVYANHHTPATYGLQSYISVPIVLPNGEFFGTLCALDPEPRQASAALGMFRLFAQLIAFHLDANQKLTDSRSDLFDANANLENSQFDLAQSEARLSDAEGNAVLREQFIAVLGHDLRNPLAALSAGHRMLGREHSDQKTTRILRHMGESVDRMAGLIDNVMDFARGRLGGGIGIQRAAKSRIEPLLAQVVNEIKTAHPARDIVLDFELADAVQVDPARFAQMFSNLLSNAITHGDPDLPILVEAADDKGHFRLSVVNGGQPIAPKALRRLFQPFQRGDMRPSAQGLGLGLYIANEIAKAHGGTIAVTSDERETRFTFTM